MASITTTPVLEIFEGVPVPGRAMIRVSYTIGPTHHDIQHEQAYRELVEIIGQDGEDGVGEVIPDGIMWDAVVVFTSGNFIQIREKDVPLSALNEDPNPIFATDEIQARVTLTPLPQASPVRFSNVVRRGQPILDDA